MNGILFKTDMIQATVDLRKTVTRRLDHLKEINKEPDKWKLDATLDDGTACFLPKHSNDPVNVVFAKPRYHVGEVVYIKEAHYRYGHWIKNGISKTGRQKWLFKALSEQVWFTDKPPEFVLRNSDKLNMGCFKRPALFLPAKLARTWLKFADVRAERLNELDDTEAIKEGIIVLGRPELNDLSRGKFRHAYVNLWDSINPKYPFSSNPFVFRYEFKMIKDGQS